MQQIEATFMKEVNIIKEKLRDISVEIFTFEAAARRARSMPE